jgi:hypothetical protein
MRVRFVGLGVWGFLKFRAGEPRGCERVSPTHDETYVLRFNENVHVWKCLFSLRREHEVSIEIIFTPCVLNFSLEIKAFRMQ